MTQMEDIHAELFQPLTEEESLMVAGGIEVTAEATYNQSTGWDAKADVKFAF